MNISRVMVGVFQGIVSFLCSNCAAPFFFFTVNLKIIKQSTNHSFCSYSSGMLSLHADNILDKEHNEPLLHTFYAKEIVIDNHACTRDFFNNICRHILAHLHTLLFCLKSGLCSQRKMSCRWCCFPQSTTVHLSMLNQLLALQQSKEFGKG